MNVNHAEIIILFMSEYSRDDVVKRFKSWSGGFNPDEVDYEDIDKFCEYAIPAPFAQALDKVYTPNGTQDHTTENFIKFMGMA